MRATQLELLYRRPSRGGARPGAGRRRLPAHARHTPHRARPVHSAAHPVHVTLRAYSRSLRSQVISKTVLRALRDSNSEHFRIAQYSVQENHVHLIVEAKDKTTLSSSLRGLMVRVARRVNRLLSRRGRFWADRWHGHALTRPREVRNALVYVLQNHKKHVQRARRGAEKGVAVLDPLSSAEWFGGFAEPFPRGFRSIGPPCIALARTWLLRVGWCRHGLIHFREAPMQTRSVESSAASQRKSRLRRKTVQPTTTFGT